ncbi:MAG TPA: phosphoribosylglycinamide formyltransferase [Thermomicrobiaceae bacterium]|nr:phosphoribosylglycinamide formyltransferase [Thermomicrobiaceae bacterium]
MEPLGVAVLLSGSGRTLENVLKQIVAGELAARVELVISTRERRGAEIARAAGIPTIVLTRSAFPSEAEFSRAVYAELEARQVDLVLLAGFLRKIEIRPAYHNRIMNIHPSLLPLFGGLGHYGERVHQAVLASGMKVSGCTVHFVDEHYDAGPIILQTCVPVLDDDTPDTLGARVFAAECRLYPEAVRLFAAGRLVVEGRRVRVV